MLYCHRSDPDTPIEETVWAMSDIVSSGKALYWGTSEWSADEIRAAIDIAERHHLHKPVTEQSQYNLLERTKVETEYARINADFDYGNTIWSPLASGLLTGKYRDGIPEDSRGALDGYGWLAERLTDADEVARVERLRPIADRLDHPAISAHGPYDLILANILARPLMSLAPAIARALSPDGRLILSGLTNDQVRMVRASYLAQGLSVIDTLLDDNWATLTLTQKQRGMA